MAGAGLTYDPDGSPDTYLQHESPDQAVQLKAVCDAMGEWGARWLDIEPHHMDPAYVLWATTKLVDVDKLPDRIVVVRFDMRDRPQDRYWMVLRKPQPELCTTGTGYAEDILPTPTPPASSTST
jgi:hypothetical protein